MRRLLAGIAPWIIALVFIIEGWGGAQAVEAEQGFVRYASHHEGKVTALVAFCKEEAGIDQVMEEAVVPNDAERYQFLMVQDVTLECYDVRFLGYPPLRVTLEKHLRTVTTVEDLVLEVWRAVDSAGVPVYTWIAHHGKDA